MSAPTLFEKRMRAAIAIVLVVVVAIAPLVGVYGLAPLVFAYAIQPYELAVALCVMLSEAVAIAALAWLVIRARR